MIKTLFKKRYSVVIENNKGDEIIYKNLCRNFKGAYLFYDRISKFNNFKEVKIIDEKIDIYRKLLDFAELFLITFMVSALFVFLLFYVNYL